MEAEKKAWVAQQQGRGGSLIKDLRLLKRQTSKPYPSYLLAKDNTIISSNTDKLQCLVEHFAEVSKSCSKVVRLTSMYYQTLLLQHHCTETTLQMVTTCPSP